MKYAYLLPVALLMPSFAVGRAPCLLDDRMDDYYDEVYDENEGGRTEDKQAPSPLSDATGKCSCSCGLSNHKSRIVGGQHVKPHEFPWLAAMVRDGRLYCAASVITATHLLTAAHCLRGFDKKDIKVVLGAHDRTDFRFTGDGDSEIRNLAKVSMHPGFDPLTFDNDIAVLTMDRPVEFSSKITPVCLPTRADGNYTDEKAVVVGWGRTEEAKPTSDLPLKVEVVVMPQEVCDQSGYAPGRITENMFCAGYTDGGRDSCQGDSGGPLHVFNKGASTEIIGVVSWGRGCARKNFPGVYTKLTRYMDFIHQNIESSCLCDPL